MFVSDSTMAQIIISIYAAIIIVTIILFIFVLINRFNQDDDFEDRDY